MCELHVLNLPMSCKRATLEQGASCRVQLQAFRRSLQVRWDSRSHDASALWMEGAGRIFYQSERASERASEREREREREREGGGGREGGRERERERAQPQICSKSLGAGFEHVLFS